MRHCLSRKYFLSSFFKKIHCSLLPSSSAKKEQGGGGGKDCAYRSYSIFRAWGEEAMIQRGGGNLRSSLSPFLSLSLSLCVCSNLECGSQRNPLPSSSLSFFLLSNRNDIRQRGGISGGDGIQQRQNRGKTVFVSFSRTRFRLGGFRRRVSSGSVNSEKKRAHLLFARPGCIAP